MIPSSLALKVSALVAAAVVNGALLGVIFRADPVRIKGGGLEQAAAGLGSGFADLAEGSPAAPDRPQPLEPDAAPAVNANEATSSAPPADAVTAEPAENASPLAAATAPVVASVPMVAPSPPARNVAPVEAAPAAPAAATAATPPETITGEAVVPEPLLRSPRPRGRPKALEQASRQPDPAPRQSRSETSEPEPARQSPRGNTETSARAGTTSEDSERHAAPSNQGSGRSIQAGNAAASNYPGLVMEELSRIRRPSVRARGTATISFSVAGSGALASVSVARSSGSASLDAEAVRLVQRAAPFPPPPSGAQKSFSINIAGR